MEPLDPELQSLVAAERREVEPSAADRERVGRSLATKVGVGFGAAIGLVSTPAAGAAVTSSGVGLVLKLGLALAIAGTAAVVVVPRLKQPANVTPAAASARPVPPAAPVVVSPSPPPVVTSEALEPTSETTAPRTSGSAGRPLPPLAEEARLLKQAQQALRDGNPGAALKALGEHQQRFPRGQLALERSAARVSALCALGRKQQAQAEAKAFLSAHPGSGLSAQVRASCGLAATDP